MQIKILSRNAKFYSTKRLVEAARARNHEISVINPLNCDLVIKKRDPNIFYKGRKIENVDAIIPRIGVSDTFFGAAVIRQFELMKVFSTVGSLALNRSRDRLRTLQILSGANLGLPKTAISNDSNNISGILNFVDNAPLIIKLLERKQGLGVVLAETNNAAVSVLEAFKGLKVRVIFQKFFKESSGSDVRAFVVDGRVVGAMKRQAKKGEFRSNLNLGGTTQIITLTDEEERSALKAAKVMKLGVCGVDMLQADEGPLILKVSPSPGLRQIEAVTKKDIAKIIIRYIEKNI
ncbi:RimK family alpha-L-glutamate ligase [Gillisia sp. Q332]|uniref:RimK family alpha-L-glutamate ligase n=1 Tax=Gillisia xinjiangensis TaxID=3384765 RepID=UPI00391DD997